MRKNLSREGGTKFVHNDLFWYKLQDKSPKKGLHHVGFPVNTSEQLLLHVDILKEISFRL